MSLCESSDQEEDKIVPLIRCDQTPSHVDSNVLNVGLTYATLF